MVRSSLQDEFAAVASICGEAGFGAVEMTLLKAAHHTSILLPAHGVVARVQSAEPVATAFARAAREIAVARHLADRGAPALSPLRSLAGPHVRGSAVVTLWPYAEHRHTATEADAHPAAVSLAAVHQGLRDFIGALPPYAEALDRCWAALSDRNRSSILSVADRDLLKSEYRRLVQLVEPVEASWVPLHGDAHLGNLLIGDGGPLWLDFEDACIGPREYDIASLPPEAWPRFAEVDAVLVAAYADLKSVCVAVWCSADPHRDEHMREAADYHLGKVRAFARSPTIAK